MHTSETSAAGTPTAQPVAAELRALIRNDSRPMSRIAALLDQLGHAERVHAIRTLGRTEQRTLWAAAGGYASLTLADIVPVETPIGREVRHFGKNTLPVYSWFEKRFCRAEPTEGAKVPELCGYNFQASSIAMAICGPGYFMAVDDIARGEVVIDYRHVPAHPPSEWPPVRSNEGGIASLVYGGMVDTLRRVSQHVTIGRANKGGKDMSAWFVLCREG